MLLPDASAYEVIAYKNQIVVVLLPNVQNGVYIFVVQLFEFHELGEKFVLFVLRQRVFVNDIPNHVAAAVVVQA